MRWTKRLFSSQVGWALLAGAAVGAVGMVAFLNSGRPAFADEPASPILTPAEAQVLADLDAATVTLVDRVRPAVVNISNGRGGQGSGVVFRSDGYIITNDHVVETAEIVRVLFDDGRTAEGKVIRDRFTDIAVVKVDREDLRAAIFGDSEEVKPGQMAVAVGSPFGLERSVTFGRVSAVGRGGSSEAPYLQTGNRLYTDMIQTDAAINPGNSGGPLLNYRGEVIGINTAIRTASGSNLGVGFAIPSNLVKVVAEQLISEGKVIRAWFGVEPENLLGYETKESGVARGSIIRSVSPDSPASEAGVKEGDVVVAIAGKPVRGEMDLRNAMLVNRPGTTIDVKVIRKGSPKTLKVTLGELPEWHGAQDQPAPLQERIRDRIRRAPRRFFEERPERSPGYQNPPSETPAGPAKLGVRVRNLTEADRQEMPGIEGVYVESVEPDSTAEGAELSPGYVITELGDTTIRNIEDLREALSGFKRGDRTMLTFVPGTEPALRTVTIIIRF
ncbi:MAG: trypsin-like peptidase domain-containing protein [Armatimonadetes bacterium]|nr:trypsin-like peptidase domain-containing protein [Armatimonadota bacterium]